jgi:SMODS and SLOG-associating 2TM effector domain 2
MSNSKNKTHAVMPGDWRIGLPWPLGPRVEDPIRVKQFSDTLLNLNWESPHVRASLASVFAELSKLAQAELRYYYMRRKAAGWKSSALRFTSWLFGTLGLLVPFIQPLLAAPATNLLPWGYIALAIAGTFIVADKVFLASEGQGRYVSTQLALERIFLEFSLKWQSLLLAYDSDPSTSSASALLEHAQAYATTFHTSLSEETAVWIEMRKKALATLEKHASAKTESEI